MSHNKQITLDDINEQFITPTLESMNYHFKVFTSVGEYQSPKAYNNARRGVINALIEATDSDISILGGGIQAIAMNISIRFLLPINDEIDGEYDMDGGYSFVDGFRQDLSDAFSTSDKITFELKEEDGRTRHFVGAVSVGFPIGGELLQRQGIGKSFEYTCYIQVAYLEDAINSRDVEFFLGQDSRPIPYTAFSISRKNTLSANTYSNSINGLSKVFAENSTYGIDISMPAIDRSRPTGELINDYISKKANSNDPFQLRIVRSNVEESAEMFIFGEVIENGAGAENVSWQVSFVPYIEAEDD